VAGLQGEQLYHGIGFRPLGRSRHLLTSTIDAVKPQRFGQPFGEARRAGGNDKRQRFETRSRHGNVDRSARDKP
jgi:hypothetical protein